MYRVSSHPVEASKTILMEYHSSQRFTHAIFLQHTSLSLFYLCVSHSATLSPSLLPTVFGSLSLSLLLCRHVFLQAPGRSPPCSLQPFGECALGLTDVAFPPGTTNTPHLKRNHHLLACPGLRCHCCVRGIPASKAWLICSDSFDMHCVLK